MKENEVQRKVVDELRKAGWLVKPLNVPHSVKAQWRGLGDAICWRWDHTLILEMKGDGGTLRESQIEFKLDLMPHIGPHVKYVVIWPPGDVSELKHWGSENRPYGTEYP